MRLGNFSAQNGISNIIKNIGGIKKIETAKAGLSPKKVGNHCIRTSNPLKSLKSDILLLNMLAIPCCNSNLKQMLCEPHDTACLNMF